MFFFLFYLFYHSAEYFIPLSFSGEPHYLTYYVLRYPFSLASFHLCLSHASLDNLYSPIIHPMAPLQFPESPVTSHSVAASHYPGFPDFSPDPAQCKAHLSRGGRSRQGKRLRALGVKRNSHSDAYHRLSGCYRMICTFIDTRSIKNGSYRQEPR
jgi:hypothetical protein